MPQKFSKQAQSGELGVAIVHEHVTRLGHAWHARTLDFGIDGQIELTDPETGEALNRLLQVQIKSRQRLDGRSENGFSFVCKPDHVRYWLNSTVPVLVIVVDPASRKAWWKNVTAWFQDGEHAKTGRVRFAWVDDQITEATRLDWLALGSPSHAPAVEVVRQAEPLQLNLLPVAVVPPNVYCANTDLTSTRVAAERLRKYSSGHGFLPFVLRDKMVYSFSDLNLPHWQVLTKARAEADPSGTWRGGTDDQRRIFQMLLLRQLRGDRVDQLDFDPRKAMLFFRADDEGNEVVINPRGKGRGRTVVKVEAPESHASGNLPPYTRHMGIRVRFVEIGQRWHLSFRPDYRFTLDGFRPHPFGDRLLTGIKGFDKHAAVRGQVRFWASWLRQNQLSLLSNQTPKIEFGAPVVTEMAMSAPAARSGQRASSPVEGGLFSS